MSRKFISLIVAASLTVASLSASQAQADNKRLRNVILGATALAILGAAASNNNRAEAVTRDHDYRLDNGYPQGRLERDRHRTGPRVTPRPLPNRVFMSELPRRCLINVKSHRGKEAIFEKRCLQRNYRHASTLPKSCNIKARSGGQRVHGYPPRCLKRHNQLLRQRADGRWLNRH